LRVSQPKGFKKRRAQDGRGLETVAVVSLLRKPPGECVRGGWEPRKRGGGRVRGGGGGDETGKIGSSPVQGKSSSAPESFGGLHESGGTIIREEGGKTQFRGPELTSKNKRAGKGGGVLVD